MDQQNNNNLYTENQIDENETSLLEIIFHYLKYWKWFVLSVVVTLGVAYTYLKFTVPVYNVSASVILKHEKNRGGGMGGSMGGFGQIDGIELMGGVSSVENETYVMRSKLAVHDAVDRLNLYTSYFVEGRVQRVDMYKNSPFVITMNKEGLQNLKQPIVFTAQLLEDNSIGVKGILGEKEYDLRLDSLPRLLITPVGNLSFILREGAEPYYEPLTITITPRNATMNAYRGALQIEPASKTSSVLNLSFKTSCQNKGADFLTTLVDVYNYQSIQDKNLEATNTKNFINERLDIIDQELSLAEGTVEEYKLDKGMTDLDVDLMQDMQQNSQYQRLLVNAETQVSIINSLNEYIRNPENRGRPVPSNVGVKDPTLLATTSEYNKLLADKERLSRSMEDNNPVMVKLREQIETLSKAINSSIESVREGLSIERQNIANQARIYSGKIGELPTRERQFTEIAREQQVKASLYLLLLKKREENALELAATANNAKLINEASPSGVIHPKRNITLLAALLLGLMIPVGIIFILNLLQNKINSRDYLKKMTKLPILGDIPHYDYSKKNNIAVSKNGTTEMDEAFRTLRTKLMLSLSKDEKVVVFTSTIMSEGKTFATINSAVSLALLGKKVLLVGLDFRLPRMYKYLGIDHDTGITDFLSGNQEDIFKLVRPTELSENLSVLTSGPIPPNPTELLSRNTLDRAFELLRTEFDYILVDSAPIGLVTDTLIINRISDANIYLCRLDYSTKSHLNFANELMTNRTLNNMLLLINDTKDFSKGYGYGYGYGHGKKNR